MWAVTTTVPAVPCLPALLLCPSVGATQHTAVASSLQPAWPGWWRGQCDHRPCLLGVYTFKLRDLHKAQWWPWPYRVWFRNHSFGGQVMHKKLFFFFVWEGVQLHQLHHCSQGNSHGWNHPTVPVKALPVPTCSPGIAMRAAGPLLPANRWGAASQLTADIAPRTQDYLISSNQMERIRALPVIPHLLILHGSQKINCFRNVKARAWNHEKKD